MTGDFPPDILKLAESVVDRGYDEGLIDAVARVLWDERAAQAERDAEICETMADKHGWNYHLPSVGRELASAIRASVKP